MAAEQIQNHSRLVLADRVIVRTPARIQQRFDEVAAKDPTAVHLDTSTNSAHQVANTIWAMIEGRVH